MLILQLKPSWGEQRATTLSIASSHNYHLHVRGNRTWNFPVSTNNVARKDFQKSLDEQRDIFGS